MGKTKMEMKRVQNPSRRQVTFSKRKNGLLKKAFELSVLCDAEVALIIFSETGKICEFASHDESMATLLAKYRIHTETAGNPGPTTLQNIKFGHSRLKRLHEKMELLERKEKNMVGEDLESLTIKELQQLERKLQIGINKICDKKMKIYTQNSKLLLQKKAMNSMEVVTKKLRLSKTHYRGCFTVLHSYVKEEGSSTQSSKVSCEESSLMAFKELPFEDLDASPKQDIDVSVNLLSGIISTFFTSIGNHQPEKIGLDPLAGNRS